MHQPWPRPSRCRPRRAVLHGSFEGPEDAADAPHVDLSEPVGHSLAGGDPAVDKTVGRALEVALGAADQPAVDLSECGLARAAPLEPEADGADLGRRPPLDHDLAVG